MRKEKEAAFHHAMLEIYDRAAELRPPYRATYFRNMVNELGGKAAADRLLATRKAAEGFTTLYLHSMEHSGLDTMKLCVEYLVLQQEWRDLFTPEQLAIARKRLQEVSCPLPAGA